MLSIQRYLLISLLISVSLVTFCAAFWTYQSVVNEVDELFDGQLVEAAHILRRVVTHDYKGNDYFSLAAHSDNTSATVLTKIIDESVPFYHHHYAVQRSFQVWRGSEDLIIKSSSAPDYKLANTGQGFSKREIDGQSWRIFSLQVPKLNLDFQIAQLDHLRTKLVKTIAFTQILPLLMMYPLLGLAVWYAVHFSLQPLHDITRQVRAKRSPHDLKPVAAKCIPQEISPLIAELNNLFARLDEAFAREKRFNADAAHELKTPLAIIRTQAQVALRALNENTRDKSLENIISGVDRCSHVVTQLSILNSLKPDEPLRETSAISLNAIAQQVIADLMPLTLDNNADIALQATEPAPILQGNATLMGILIRNLVDNALRYSGENGNVLVQIKTTAEQRLLLQVEDNGPGIPADLRQRVFDRFYRQLGTNTDGSGLGLSIVKQIAALHFAKIILCESPTLRGACFIVEFDLAAA